MPDPSEMPGAPRAEAVLLPEVLLPIAPRNVALADCAVAVADGAIAAVGPRDAVLERCAGARRIELPGHALLPGLVNAHGHLAMTLLRGLGEGQPLDAWLRETIWPLEGRWVDGDFVRDGTRLAIAEMIAAGTTTASDMYYHPDAAAAVAIEAGFRLRLAFPVFDMPTPYARDADECFDKGLALRDKLRDETLATACFGPHAPYTVATEHLERIARLADETDAGVHIHLHETAAEVADAQRRVGKRWIAHLDDVGLLNENLEAVHMTAVTDAEIDLCAERGVRIVHCPHSNMKLASGVCPVRRFAQAGAAVGLGTDGAASNNSLDMFAEARLAALSAKALDADPTALPAADALAMATLGGARALGMEERIGSIEVGKRADLIAVDTRHPAMQPLHSPHAQLVHGSAGARVSHVFIDGRLVYRNGAYASLDIDAVLDAAQRWRGALAP